MSDIKTQWIKHFESVLSDNRDNRLTTAVINGLIFAVSSTLPPFAADQPPAAATGGTQVNRLLPPNIRASEKFSEVAFAVWPLETALDHGLPELHELHWQETEGYRNDLPLKPDYGLMQAMEAQGRFLLFVMCAIPNGGDVVGELVGNFMVYIDRSTHTGLLVAREDTIFVKKEWRGQGRATAFIEFIHATLAKLGVTELRIDCKTSNHVGELMKRRHGYEHVSNGYVKRLDRSLYAPLEAVKASA